MPCPAKGASSKTACLIQTDPLPSSDTSAALWVSALGVNWRVHSVSALEAMRHISHRTVEGEIVGDVFHQERVTTGRKDKFCMVWPNNNHLGIVSHRGHSHLVGIATDDPGNP